jgi:hypothetical protein
MKLMLLSCLVRLCVRVFVCMHPRAPPLPTHTLQANMPKVTRTEKLQAPNAAGRKRRNGGQRRPTGVAAQAHTVGAVASLLDQLATFEPPTLEPRHGGLDAGGFGSRHHRETLDAAERGPALHAALKVGGAPLTATAARCLACTFCAGDLTSARWRCTSPRDLCMRASAPHVQWMLADALHFALHVALLSYRLALAT